MLKRIIEAVLISLITAVLMIGTTFFFSKVNNPEGYIRFIDSVMMDGENNLLFEIENISKHYIDDLIFRTDFICSVEEIKTSIPVTIKITNNYSNGIEFTISHIAPKSNFLIQMPNKSGHPSQQALLFTNMEEKNFKTAKNKISDNILNKDISYYIIVAIIYCTIYFISNLYGNLSRDKQRRDFERLLEEVKSESKNMGKKIEDADKRYQSMLVNQKKINFLLRSRLFDYSKELSFWRNTIKEIIINSNSQSNIEPDELIKLISIELKTYQTLTENTHYFETVTFLSKLVVDYESKVTANKEA